MPLELSDWITPAILIASLVIMLRSFARLEDRLNRRIDEQVKALGARIDETNKRIAEANKANNEQVKALGARIDETNKSIAEANKANNEQGKALGVRLDRIEERLRVVEHGQAKLEGLLEGLREAISGRRPAA